MAVNKTEKNRETGVHNKTKAKETDRDIHTLLCTHQNKMKNGLCAV